MRLLVSVGDVAEARTALTAGADVIDAKNPRRGSLGAVTPGSLRAIIDAVGPQRPVSAALGDARSTDAVRRRVATAATSGVAFVKVGFRGVATAARALRLAGAARDACAISPETSLVLVAYADATRAGSPAPIALLDVAARSGAAGVLLDTFAKAGGGLFAVLPHDRVCAWVAAAHDRALHAGIAGGLGERDLALAAASGADLVGVRSAACDGGRYGRVAALRVARLAAALRPTPSLSPARA